VFDFPTDRGSVRAVAIPSSWREPLTGLYSALVGLTFIQIWVIAVAIFIWRCEARRASTARTQIVRVAHHEEEKFFKVWTWWRTKNRGSDDRHRREYAWLAGVFVIFATNLFLGPVLVQQLVLGDGAPANGDSLYFPAKWEKVTGSGTKNANIFKPSALRALGVAQLGTPSAVDRVQVSQVGLGHRPDSQAILGFDYSYNLTARDYGMQRFGGLRFDVKGHCYTEYDWVDAKQDNLYHLWNNPAHSRDFNARQKAFPQLGLDSDNGNHIDGSLAVKFNWTAFVSTAAGFSSTNGTDPWYLTDFEKSGSDKSKIPIKSNRPVLSCWETNVWTLDNRDLGDSWTFYDKNNQAVAKIMRDIFYSQIGQQPAVVTTGRSLDTLNLAISEQDTSTTFDAASASILKDLRRLLVTTFVWNANILLDTSLNELAPKYDVPNLLENDRTGAAGFVVPTTDATSMSLAFIIVVPCLLCFALLVGFCVDHMLSEKTKTFPCWSCGQGEQDEQGVGESRDKDKDT